jgi:hypothetical protein
MVANGYIGQQVMTIMLILQKIAEADPAFAQAVFGSAWWFSGASLTIGAIIAALAQLTRARSHIMRHTGRCSRIARIRQLSRPPQSWSAP